MRNTSKTIAPIYPLIALILVLVADQCTKSVISSFLYIGESIPEHGFFRITHVTNTGSAFGMFVDHTYLLIFASLIGILILIVFYRSQPFGGTILHISIGLQLGGAIGNLVDRVRLGYVVDFIDVGLWPVFNIADSAIVIGLVGLVWSMIFLNKKTEGDEYSAELDCRPEV